jgi:manganese transport protein
MESPNKCGPIADGRRRGTLDFLRYLGPGLLVTIGFIDPGNWATNVAAGSVYGYALLWVVTLGTVFLILLQHNSAHLGIVTGTCLAEAATAHMKPWASRASLGTALAATASTALAELLGGAIALNMLFGIPAKIGTLIVLALVLVMLFTNSYRKLEKWIIGFVSVIGFSFLIELVMVHIDWPQALRSWVTPVVPHGSMVALMSVLGAVVMPHNLYLHSEIIQSRQWNCEDEVKIKRQLKYEYTDTIFSMTVGWAINSAMILVAAATFFANHVQVTELSQAHDLLTPLLGSEGGVAAAIFAVALLFSGVSACITAGMAGGSIFTGMFGKPYDISDRRTKWGIAITMIAATIPILFMSDLFKGLVLSQMVLSIQLPITIFTQLKMTSSKKVMGKFRNSVLDNILLWGIGAVVVGLNIALLVSQF